jgi:mitochondrial splicing suppressor protein 51
MQISLKSCPICHLVFKCETCTPPVSHECELYQKVGNIELFRLKHLQNFGQLLRRAQTGTPRSSFRALTTAKNWLEYYTDISDKKDMLGSFIKSGFSLDKAALQILPDLAVQEAVHLLMIATEVLSMPLTILAALEDSLIDASARKTLSVHMLGANAREYNNLKLFEEILHLVPSLQTLKIVLIGPGCDAAEQKTDETLLESCPACSSSGRKRTIAIYQGLYQDYVEESHYQKPDLAVLFHSGRSQVEVES